MKAQRRFLAAVLASSIATSSLAVPVTFVDVVVVPHSHDDAGWQRTFEGYYRDETKAILNNVMAWLSTNPQSKFIWVETSFLQRWWLDQNETARDAFKGFVASGRLELVGGGWTMHDEESTNAYSAVTNMEYGLSWLQQQFGSAARPRFLWHIDPSGHAAITPTLAAELGYDALVIDRVPDPVRQAFRANQSLQFVWTAVNTTGSSGTPSPSILAIILDSFYCNPHVAGSNVSAQAQSFYNDVIRRIPMYRPDDSGRITVLWPWGCDFAFQHYADFSLMEGVLDYMTAYPADFPNVTARFGTLADYFDSLHAQTIAFPTQGKRDFHPYVWCYEPNNPGLCFNLPTTPDPAYWRSGMYTSKVALKGLSRVQDASTHAVDALYVQAKLEGASESTSRAAGSAGKRALRGSKSGRPVFGTSSAAGTWLEAVGWGRSTSSLMTHHDAITGTAYISCSLGPPYDDCNCYADYMMRMASALNATEDAAGAMKGYLLSIDRVNGPIGFSNATQATANWSPNMAVVLAVSNPLGWARREVVRLPILAPPSGPWMVGDLRSGQEVPAQIVIDSARGGAATLYFLADVPALSTVTYGLIQPPGDKEGNKQPAAPSSGAPTVMDNGAIAITFDSTGRIASWTNKSSGTVLPWTHDFYYYQEKMAGGDLIGGTVYGFEPLDDKHPVLLGSAPNGTGAIQLVVTANGPLVWEVSQFVNDWITHTIRLFAPDASPPAPNAGYAHALDMGSIIEFQTLMAPPPFPNGTGGSVVSSFTPGGGCTLNGTSAYTQLTTDSSGFQTLVRPAYNPAQYAQGQVYPTWPGWDLSFGPCSSASPADSPSAFASGAAAVLSHIMHRPAGTAVQSNTTVWQMLHRRLLNPLDDRGNDDVTIDDVRVLSIAEAGSGWGADPEGYLLRRQVQGRLVAHPLTIHGANYADVQDYFKVGQVSYTPAWLNATSLPSGVHLHSLLSRDSWYPPAPSNATDGSGTGFRKDAATAPQQFAIRLQQLPYAPSVAFPLTSFLANAQNATEVTPDLNADKAASDGKRLTWRTLGGSDLESSIAGAGDNKEEGDASIDVAFDAEYVKSYTVTLPAAHVN